MDRTEISASLKRTALLTAHRLADDVRPLGWALGAVAAANLGTLAVFRHAWFQESPALWASFVVFFALITASGAFRAMHEGRSSADWILWPASPTEKYAAAFAEAVVLVPLGLTLACTALSAVVAGLEQLVLGRPSVLWNPLSWEVSGWVSLFITVLIFLTGAAAFRKHAFWKTSLAVIAGLVLITVVAAAMLWSAGAGHWSLNWAGFDGDWEIRDIRNGRDLSESTLQTLNFLAGLWFYGALPVFCLAFGWAKVREKEARDEVQ